MADFLQAFERMMLLEGGYRLHIVKGDRGGMTYAGIARNFNPSWPGWAFLDRHETPPTELVRDFYRAGYWSPISGDVILDQRIANVIFDFAVNTSGPGRPAVAIKVAQVVVGATPDGVLGPKTLAALNLMNPELFLAHFTIARITRYRDIVMRDRSQAKFLLGWLNRSLAAA